MFSLSKSHHCNSFIFQKTNSRHTISFHLTKSTKMVQTRSMSRAGTSENSLRTKKIVSKSTPELTTVSFIESDEPHCNSMFRSIEIHFNKNQQQQRTDIELRPESTATTSAASQSKPTTSNAETSLRATTPTTMLPQSRQLAYRIITYQQWVRVFNGLQTILGAIGGIYAIYRLVDTHIMQREERLEVLVLRRS